MRHAAPLFRRGFFSGWCFCLGLLASFTPAASRAADPATATTTATPSAATPAPGEIIAANERWQALLAQLRPYGIPQLEELAAAGAPATLEELAQRLDQLFAATALQSARRYWTYENNVRQLTDERVRLEEARVEHTKLEQQVTTVPDRLKAAEAQAADLAAQAAREELIAATLRDNAAVLEEDFTAARGTTLGAVYYLLPTNQRVAFHEGTQKNSSHPAYAKLPEVEAERRASPAAAMAKPSVVRKADTGPTQPPPAVAGTIEEKFAAFVDKERALRNLAALLPPQEKQLASLRAQAEEQVGLNAELGARLTEFSGPFAAHAATATAAEDRILTAQVNQKIAAGNLLRLGTAAVLWSHLKESVVAPQMENFLETNGGLAKGRKGLALLDEINRQPQQFIPKKGVYENPQPLGALRLKLLDVEADLETRGAAAADAFQAGKLANGDLLAGHLFKNLDKQGVAVMRAATNTLTPGQDKIAAALLAHAPAE